MKSLTPIFLIVASLLAAMLCGSAVTPLNLLPKPSCIPGTVPHTNVINIPKEYQARNWGSSCVWSSTVSMLRAIGDHKDADWIRNNRSGGSWPSRLNATLQQLRIPYAYTTDGDQRLVEWGLKHRYPVGIEYGVAHAQLLVGRTDGNAVILNNFSNGTKVYTVPWSTFLKRWPGWAWVCVPNGVTPPPEVPFFNGGQS